MLRLLMVTLTSIFMVSCAPDAYNLVLNNSYPVVATDTRIDATKCQYIITDLQDNRKDKKSLGALDGRPVSGEDVMQWLKNGLMSTGIKIAPAELENSITVNMTVGLKLASVKSSSTSMATNLVVGVSFAHETTTTYLRGNYCRINWWGQPGEIKASFDGALEKVLSQLPSYAQEHCIENAIVSEAGKS